MAEKNKDRESDYISLSHFTKQKKKKKTLQDIRHDVFLFQLILIPGFCFVLVFINVLIILSILFLIPVLCNYRY